MPECKINLEIGGKPIGQVETAKLLGVTIDETLTWDVQISKVRAKISKKIGLLKRLKKCMPQKTLYMLYNSIILPHFDYADIIWGTACEKYVGQLYKLQKRAARILVGAKRFSKTEPILMG